MPSRNLKIIEKSSISLDEILERIVNLIPPAWQYPEITCARISINSEPFTTPNFQLTEWKQIRDIIVNNENCSIPKRKGIMAAKDEADFYKELRQKPISEK